MQQPRSGSPPREAAPWALAVVACLKRYRIRFINYVPDSISERVLELARNDAHFDLLPLTREEEGVGVACGQAMGGQRGVLMMPTAGLGNAVNALASLPVAYRIPFPILVGYRGGLGEFNAAQVTMGQATPAVLDALGIPAFVLRREREVERVMDGALKLTYASEGPVAVLLSTQLAGWKEEQ